MNKAEFVDSVVAKSGVSKKEVEAIVKAYQEVVEETLKKGEQITFVGFGTYSVVEKAARTGRNPKTGETIQIAAKKSPKFKFSKSITVE